jgi:radical SAM superfamily enzyme YgiQ (UPF0313 family)
MKVLLLSPPYVAEYMRNARCDYVGLSTSQWYPIWLSYCGALLEREGHPVRLIDAPAYGLDRKATTKAAQEFSPDLIVVYSSTKSEKNDIEFATSLKALTGARLVFVGPFVSILPEEILRQGPEVDFAIKGEFDFPVLELAEGREPEGIKNLFFRRDGEIKQNPLRNLLSTAELDSLPFVTDFYRRHLDLKKYKVPQELFPFVDLFTGRGCCYGQCTFCLWPHSFIRGAVYNKRSIDNVLDELEFVKEHIPQAKEVFIQDDTLPGERARELSEGILSRGLEMVWSCYARANMDYQTLALMKRAGCRNLHIGYESASNQVLKNIKKGISRERMTRFTEDAKRAGLRVHGDFLVGLNGETQESIKQTIRWAKELDPHTAQFSILNIYPATPFYEYLSEHGFIEDGEPSYPHLTSEELRRWAKRGYAEFYLNGRYIKRILRQPQVYLFGQFRPIWRMVSSIFWRRW